ncbi:zinc ABC transporter substrate-binding protein [Phaeobacter sp. B1627]|uniref:zinc ABC transporter substrate-binding protein n=1 Tax=Phaeobacter sp. B1627 TaxID=2583809 RepID=UPI001117D260|nr:zinc ABC transporter substrate-binding protein [Phaeobacter sp. B1627]TNJ45923.1 zinc transporter [Phaeobacter sp. B1627]
MHRCLPLSFLISSVISTTAIAETPRVVTDIAPVQGLVSRVMAGISEPDMLIPPGSSPHAYSLRPSDARALSSADVVFWIGDELETWLGDPLEQLAGDARIVALLDLPGTLNLPFRNDAIFAEDHHSSAHDHEAGHDEHDEHHDDEDGHSDHDHEDHDQDHDDHAHDGHDHEGIDPHAWLAPANGKVWLEVIAEELAAVDPDNADLYLSNAQAGQAEIDLATSAIRESLPTSHGAFVVFHDAYQYFEHSFGLRSLGAISLGDATDPSVARIAEIREAVANAGVTCVFSEPQFNPSLVDTVTKGTEVKAHVIDPLGLELVAGPDFYTDLLIQTGHQFSECLAR